MSSGFSGGRPDLFAADRSMNSSYNSSLNQQQQFSFPSPLSGVLPEPFPQIRRANLIGKRSLTEFEQQNQQGLGFYLRNVKSRPNYHLPPLDFSPVPSISPEVSPNGLPILQQHLVLPHRNFNNLSPNLGGNRGNNLSLCSEYSEKKMMNHRLQELEKELLGDEEEEDDGEAVSVLTNSEWSETIQSLLNSNQKSISPSPTSSSSSCCSTSASPQIPCIKQSLIDAAVAISEGKSVAASQILTRLQQVANRRGTPEQRLTAYMVSALKPRVHPTQHPFSVIELYSKEHMTSIQILYDISPCFQLGFVAANLAILETASEQGFRKIHVVDFDIGEGGQYAHLLHALSEKKSGDTRAAALNITAFTDSASGDEQRLKLVGERLKASATKLDVCFNFSIKNLNIRDLNREKLGIGADEALAVNFAFKLHALPDESVTTENPRDELLRRVKSLAPTVTTVVEQDMNANTAPLAVRVRETCEHYGALLESLEASLPRDNPNRVRVEEALGRKMGNSVACEGRERVERCEVFGKWKARLGMAGFQPVPMSRPVADSVRVRLSSGTRGNSGFTVEEQSGGICFGWMGRTLTVVSTWR